MSRTITDWQYQIHQNNVLHGFYDYKDDLTKVGQLLGDRTFGSNYVDSDTQEALARLLADYQKAMLERKLLLVIGELCEAHEELRNGHQPAEVYEKDGKPEGFPIETTDAHIRLFDLEQEAGINTEEQMLRKHTYNLGRSYKHGKCW